MPIYLPPLTRRRFVAGLAWGGAALACRPSTAFEPTGDPHRWALISDTHVAAKRETLRGKVNMARNLEQVVGQIVALERKPAGVLHAGDAAYLTGEAADYATLGELLKPLAEAQLAAHIALGNHDHRERFWQTLAAHRPEAPPVAARHVSVVRGERANWFVLDSLDKTDVVSGVLGAEQLAWLAKALDAHADKPALVIVHHNPFAGPPPKPAAKTAPAEKTESKTPADKPQAAFAPVADSPAKTTEAPAKTADSPAQPATKPPGGLTSATTGLTDIGALLQALAPRKQVKALIFGHTHHWERGQADGIHLVNLPPTAYAFNAADPSGWVDVSLRTDGATFELRALDTSHKAHGQKFEMQWR